MKHFEIYPETDKIDENLIEDAVDKKYENELLNSLIESQKEKVYFQNARNNVEVANTHRPNSKMCLLM